MKLKNGFLTQDSDGTVCFHTERPRLYTNSWDSDGYMIVRTEMFDDIDFGDDHTKSLRQILNGKVIMPLPELEVDARVEAKIEGEWFQLHFSHFDIDGVMYVYKDGTTSWTATSCHTVNEWRLPEED